MQIKVTDKPEGMESVYYADEITMDKGGVDLHMPNGLRYSANWGEFEASEVGELLIWEDFLDAGVEDREIIRDSLAALVKTMGNYLV